MKKFLCGLLCAALLPLATMPAFAEPEETAAESASFTLGHNLFLSPDFKTDETGAVPQWYTGTAAGNAWDGSEKPDINNTDGVSHLTPLKPRENSVFSTGTDENVKTATGSESYLKESLGGPTDAFWSARNSLQAYVPIEGGKTYYFSYWAYAGEQNIGNGSVASVRYGAVNSESFIDASNGNLTWSDDLGVRVGSNDGANFKTCGKWSHESAMFTAGNDADYFFFNLYWLQVSNDAKITGFNLQEVTLNSIDGSVFDSGLSLIKAVDGKTYIALGQNLFINPNFVPEDVGSLTVPQWYVGDNTQNSWNGSVPDPKTEKNLTPLTPLTNEEGEKSTDSFYYSSGGAIDATGSDNFLCETIGTDEGSDTNGDNCYWNGKYSLQAYVKIDPNKTYYFSYDIFTNADKGNNDNATVRYGAINSDDFCDRMTDHGYVKWSGKGGVDAGEFGKNNGENVQRKQPWTKKDAIITSYDGADYFFYNLYWLQTIDYVCIDEFNLVEIYPIPLEELTSELGYDETKGFTVDFSTGSLGENDAVYIYREADDGGPDVKVSGPITSAELGGDGYISVAGNSNAVYKALMSVKEADGSVVYRLGKNSIYSLLVSDIAENSAENGAYTADGAALSKIRVTKANEIIAKGGVIEELTDQHKKIMTKADGKKEFTVIPAVFGLGIGFTVQDGKIYVGGTEMTVNGSGDGASVFNTLTVNGDNTVTLSVVNDGVASEAMTLSLDSVNIEFIETLIEESEAEDADMASDFVPEL